MYNENDKSLSDTAEEALSMEEGPLMLRPGAALVLESLYLGAGVKFGEEGPSGHRIRLELKRGFHGSFKGGLLLDPNVCSINEFGDPEMCTKMFRPPFEVTVTRMRLADPKHLGRAFFQVAGEHIPPHTALIVSPGMKRCYLLVAGQSVALYPDDGA